MANVFDKIGGQQGGPMRGGGLTGVIFNKMYSSNPEFRDFADSIKDKSLDQVCSERGIDKGQVADAMKNPAEFLSQRGFL